MTENSSSESLESLNQDDASSWEFIDSDSASLSNSRPTNQQTPQSSNVDRDSYTVPKKRMDSNRDDSTSDSKTFSILDIDSEEQIHELSVRQIKLLLTRNFVDFKGCCEKEELLAKAIRLWRDVHKFNNQGILLNYNIQFSICLFTNRLPLDQTVFI